MAICDGDRISMNCLQTVLSALPLRDRQAFFFFFARSYGILKPGDQKKESTDDVSTDEVENDNDSDGGISGAHKRPEPQPGENLFYHLFA
jgi:hypothetical protein